MELRPFDAALGRIAASQHAVFTDVHARACGLSDRQIRHRKESRQWLALYKEVSCVAGAPLGWKGLVLAACWAGGFRAAASHRSAAALHGLPGGRDDLVEITCPRWRRARQDRLVVHETKAIGPCDITIIDGVPVTSVERTLLDLGAVCRPMVVRMALDAAEHRGLTTQASVRGTLRRLGRSGRPGVTALRLALEDAELRRGVPESVMETLMLEVIRRNGLPEPVLQYEIFTVRGDFVARVDAAYPGDRVAIEYDSKQEHTGELALARDNSRRNRLVRQGYLPVVARYGDLKSGGTEFCSTLHAALRRSS